jgi:hypothetical protein
MSLWTYGFWASRAPFRLRPCSDFYVKLTIIGLAIWVMYKLRTNVFADATLSESEMTARGAKLAKWSLLLWFAAITAGRLLAYTYKYLTYPS